MVARIGPEVFVVHMKTLGTVFIIARTPLKFRIRDSFGHRCRCSFLGYLSVPTAQGHSHVRRAPTVGRGDYTQRRDGYCFFQPVRKLPLRITSEEARADREMIWSYLDALADLKALNSIPWMVPI